MIHGKRANADIRGYDHRWRRASTEFLRRYPWCWGCQAIGVRRKADLVDHVVPHRGDMIRFWNSNNWQAACKWHHDSVKAELERRFEARKIPASELHLQSATAVKLTRERHRPAVGVDGFPIPGT